MASSSYSRAGGDPGRRARQALARHGVQVLKEDNHLLVVAKPPGLPSQGGTGIHRHLVELIERYRRESEQKPGAAYVGLVHRLDRNVSGVMVIAKTSKAARRLADAFKARAAGLEKTYLAWVAGLPTAKRGELVHHLKREQGVTRTTTADDEDAKLARLTWVLEGAGPTAARLRVDLHSGRSHQIRAQLAAIGLPLHGDVKYGGPRGVRPALHAVRLVFPHPVGGERVEVVARPPPDLLRLERGLRIQPPAS